MAVLDGQIANTALPTIARELHATPAASIWVVNGFQLAVTMTILSCASLGDSRGLSTVYRFGLGLFTFGSLCCALAPTLPLLVTARVLQGFGAAALMAIVPSMYRAIFPPRELGRALGLSAVIVATSAAAGPAVGGAVLHFAPWPWLFAINIPLGVIALAFSRALPVTPGTRKRIDVPSIGLSALAFGAIIYGLDGFARHDALAIIGVQIAIGAIAGTVFVRRQIQLADRPLLAVDLFRIPTFSLASITSCLTFTAQGLAFVALPFYFQATLGRTPFESGLLLTSWPLATAIVAPIAGYLSDTYPAGILTTIGLVVYAFGLGLYAVLPAHPGTVTILVHGAICGLGFGFFQSPNNRELVGSAPRTKTGSAAGVLAAMRLSGQTVGAAVVAIAFGALTLGAALPLTLWIACACAGAGAVASGLRLRLPRPAVPVSST